MLSEVTERAFIVNSLLFRAIIRLGRHQRCNRSQDVNVSINQCRVAPFLQLSVVSGILCSMVVCMFTVGCHICSLRHDSCKRCLHFTHAIR